MNTHTLFLYTQRQKGYEVQLISYVVRMTTWEIAIDFGYEQFSQVYDCQSTTCYLLNAMYIMIHDSIIKTLNNNKNDADKLVG